MVVSHLSEHVALRKGLGPTLYTFYINGVFRHIDDRTKIMMFADDCGLYKSEVCCNMILRCLQGCLNNYVDWGKEEYMYFISTIQLYNLYIHSII